MPLWWPRRRSKSKHSPEPAPAGAAASSPRNSVDVQRPTTTFASASTYASPSAPSGGPRTTRGLDDSRADSAAATRCCGGTSRGAAAGRGLPLPRPAVSSSAPQLSASSRAEACGGCASARSSVSCCSSSESDEAVDPPSYRHPNPVDHLVARTMPTDAHKRMMEEEKHLFSCSVLHEQHKFFEAPITIFSSVGDVHLQNFGASTSGAPSRGRMLRKDTFGVRTRSLSPGPRGHASASSYANPGDLGFSPNSTYKRMDDLKSLSQPLPLPPAPSASFSVPSSPIASAQYKSQWKKGKLLGSGTFGQVYLGFNSESGQFCAIKEVQVILDDSRSKEQLRQLNQEIDMLRQLSHQNIVQYYRSELSSEALSIYLEYVSGGSIYKLLRDYGPLKETVIRSYTRQILSGLAYLHGRKTVHRDIKGANILVGPNGDVKLADFGVAKHITSFAEIRSFRGSPYWMAPEVIMNENGYSFEVDIWSLGCTIIEMGTGRHPWYPYRDVPAMFKIANSKDIPEIPESFSKEGKDFLSLCLKRDPAERPSATELLGHPFVHVHQAVRETKCNTIQLRNGLAFPAEACHKKSSRELSSKRSIAPLRNIGRISARDFNFTGFSTAQPSPSKTFSSHIDVRTNISLPVSPCSSPLRQFKQSNWSCLPSPSHPACSAGSAAYNPVSYMQNQRRRSITVPDPWHDMSQKPPGSYGSPKRF